MKAAILLKTLSLALACVLLLASCADAGNKSVPTVSYDDVTVIDCGSFHMRAYSDIIARFPSERKVDTITTYQEAADAAKAVWLDTFEYLGELGAIHVQYDTGNDCWYVYGELPSTTPPIAGGVPNIIIKSDGTVLALWHTQ